MTWPPSLVTGAWESFKHVIFGDEAIGCPGEP